MVAPTSIARYIGLGDSISIDDYPGPGLGAISLLYQNRDHLYPEFAGRDLLSLNPDTRLHPLAFDGATTVSVLTHQLRELPDDGPGRTLVTLTAGGNDLLQLLGTRYVPGERDAEEIAGNIRRIVDRLLERYADPLILVGTIYDPTDGAGDLEEPGLSFEEGMFLLEALNGALRAMERRPEVRVADIHRHFLGHGSHHQEPAHPYYHADDPSCWYMLEIEPNQRGGSEIRRVFWETLTRG